MFNALQYTKNLEENGFERAQAEILVRMFMQMIEFNMLSKSDFEKYRSDSSSDLRNYRSELRAELEKYRAESSSNIEKLRQEMYHGFEKVDDKLNKLSLQLTIKLAIMLALSVGLLSTIMAIKL